MQTIMNETNKETSTADSVVILSEASSTTSLSAPTVDDETRRRKILSKLWGKGNKLSHKVRELDKSSISNSSDSSIYYENDQQQLIDNPKDNSNSINNSKPLAVVKPIVVVKSGSVIYSVNDRTRQNSETTSTAITQIDEITTATTTTTASSSSTTTRIKTTVTERQPSSTVNDETSSKKKKTHKNKESKTKKTTRDDSNERNRSQHHRHHKADENTNKKSDSSSKNCRREENKEISINDNYHKSSRYHSSSTTSLSNNRRRSPSNDIDHANRSTISKKNESSSSRRRSTLSPIDRHRSNSKYKSNRHRHGSSATLSPSPSRSRHSTKNEDRIKTKSSSSHKKDDHRSSRTTKSNRKEIDSSLNSKSKNSNSPSDSRTHHHHSSHTNDHNDNHQQKTHANDENIKNSSKSQTKQEKSSDHRSSSSMKQDKSKLVEHNDENNSSRRKPTLSSSSSSRFDRRSYSRHRSQSKDDKTNRKIHEQSINKQKNNYEKDSTTINEISNNDKKSISGSSNPSINEDHRRKSSSDYHRYDRHNSPLHNDRRNDYYDRHHHHHRIPLSHSYYSNSRYDDHHRYRSRSSKYHYHHHRLRYFSSTSSSLSFSPRRRRSSTSRTSTSSTSSRSSSSYSSISRTSSSRSSSRHNHYYHHEKKFRRSPTLEKLFLKASESIESISTEKNPKQLSHVIPIQTATTNFEIPISSSINSISQPNRFYSDSFSGFSAPPPPFISQLPQQRCLKEITTELSTSRRSMLNEIQIVQPPNNSSTSVISDEVIPIKTVQNDPSTNVRLNSNKPPRISRFSDASSSGKSEIMLNTNLPVDTLLNYMQISENINCLPSSRRQQKRHNREVMECECTTSEYDRSRGVKACGHECLNRMLLIECGPMCPCGQWCTNRRFQRRSYANHKLALFKTEMKGYGLRTIGSIRKGRFLVEYIGDVIDMDELARRNKKYKRDGNVHQYVMSLIHGTVIDSTIKGNWARFINHSCEPNCVAEKWLVNGEYRMGIFAKRDLNVNEEITIDYRFETFGTADLTNEKCYCGAPTCRGTISVKNNNNNNNNNSNKRQNRRTPLDDDELLDYLRDDDTNEYIIPKTIDEIRQLIQIMSRTESENVRTVELDLIKNGSLKQVELPRLFLECNGLHVLCSWMKDILIDDDEQQYSDEFKLNLLDFIHSTLPIKDRTIVMKNGLIDLVYKKLQLPKTNQTCDNDQQQINDLMNSILNHLDNPIITKLFHIYSTWMSLKERFIIPKRKESSQTANYYYHHHHHHHHHNSKHPNEENNYRLSFSTRSSTIQQKSYDRLATRRSYIQRDIPRTQEQKLSKDERRKLFEQQYEDAEKAKAAAAAAAANNESPGSQNEPPNKKQRKSDNTEHMSTSTPPQSQGLSTSNVNCWTHPSNSTYPNSMDQSYWIYQHLSQIPIEYIRSYMASIDQPIPMENNSTNKDDPPLSPPTRPDDENELSRIIRLPAGWSVATCPSDSSIYFYNRETMTTSWTLPSMESSSKTPIQSVPLELSPLSSAQVNEQRRPNHSQQLPSSSHAAMKLSKYAHRHSRSHRHHHHHHTHHININNKRKRPSVVECTTVNKQEQQIIDETLITISNKQINQDENNENKSMENADEMPVVIPQTSTDENPKFNELTTVDESSEMTEHLNEQISSNNNTLSSSTTLNRDLLRKSISQHVHTTLKPYTKRTCKQGRIASTEDIKYLVKKFTLAVLDKEIEKAKNEGIPLSPILTDRVRLKTEVYVKKYMNKMGSVFQRHQTNVHPTSQPTASQPTITLDPE